MKNSIKFGLLLGILVLLAGPGRAHDTPKHIAAALTLNGHQVYDYNTIWLTKQGVLAFVEGNPQSKEHKPLLFRVALRRAGNVVKQWPSNETEGLYSVQLEDLWSAARLGDELIVEPVNALAPQSVENPGRRVIKLQGFNWLSHCLPVDKC
ncbi:hypothetical protein [uncultured Fibrella sp.]|uniref:hypothetical protein n=1 Tax=uncultured Fibrella sp. TaxID=1284596 RepID=UPI0035CA03F5